MANLKEKYEQTVVPELEKAFGLKNPMQVPRLQKIVVNMAFGIVDKDTQKSVVDDLEKITGQKPALCPAKKSVANFKLREGMVIGAKVTLRRGRMWDFLDRLVNVALPRIRDFHGVPNRGFDGRGNYSLGLKEQTIFPEIDLSRHGAPEQGMDITIVTTAKDNKAARALLEGLGGGAPATFTSRAYNRCSRCGRPRGYIRKFKLCRLCFRELALQGRIPGVAKASW